MTFLQQPMRLAAALAGAAPADAQAVPVVIANPGFEANAAPPGAFLALMPSGWRLYDPSGVVNQADNVVGVIRPLPGTEFVPTGTPGIETDFDNVRLDAQVLSTGPEPAIRTLMGLRVAWLRGSATRRRAAG